MNTSKKQNVKKERMNKIISKEIRDATKFVYSPYPGDKNLYNKYTILNLGIERDTIFLDVKDSNKKETKYTLNHFEEFLNRKTGPFCTF